MIKLYLFLGFWHNPTVNQPTVDNGEVNGLQSRLRNNVANQLGPPPCPHPLPPRNEVPAPTRPTLPPVTPPLVD